MNKSLILLMLGCSLPVLMAANEASTAPSTVSASEVTAMQKQIADLQKQLAVIVKQMQETKVVEHKVVNAQQVAKPVAEAVVAPTVTKEEPKKENEHQFDKGYIAIPGTTGAVKFSGMVKLDMIRDTRANTSEQTCVGHLPYALQMRNPNLPNTPAAWKDQFYMHAKQSKFRLETLVKNKSGSDVNAYVEGDFYGVTQWGDAFPNGTTGNNAPQSSTTYTFRLRHAIIAYSGLEVGHTTTTFNLDEIIMPSVDLNGINGYNRHALIRYTHKLGNFAITAAAEHARADYMTYTPTPTANGASATTTNYAYNTQDSAGNLSKPERPDLILRLKYNFDNGSVVGLSVINRDLRVQNNAALTGNLPSTVDGKTYIANSWGVNLTAKIMTVGGSFFTGGITTGKGLGWYLLDATGRSAFFDPNAAEGQKLKPIEMNMFWAGYSHVWCPQWQTTIGLARITLGTQGLSNARKVTQWYEPGLDRTYNKFLINTMYMPEENLKFGLEYFVLERKSTLGYKGLGHRLQFAASYNF